MLVKICGLSNYIDAKSAISYGANALGFVMGGNVLPVEVEPHAQIVREIITFVPKQIDTYLVTHLTEVDAILDLANYIQCSGIQISEEISVEKVRMIRKKTNQKIIKTVVVQDQTSIKKMQAYEPYCDYILLDSKVAGYTGGTGMINDWNLCKKLIDASKNPVFLAGGLTPENVKQAIFQTHPAGVDVSTGVSTYSPLYLRKDRKDPKKIKQFISIAKKIQYE